jgi:hypothetical protein
LRIEHYISILSSLFSRMKLKELAIEGFKIKKLLYKDFMIPFPSYKTVDLALSSYIDRKGPKRWPSELLYDQDREQVRLIGGDVGKPYFYFSAFNYGSITLAVLILRVSGDEDSPDMDIDYRFILKSELPKTAKVLRDSFVKE